jgi:hypothetical protein
MSDVLPQPPRISLTELGARLRVEGDPQGVPVPLDGGRAVVTLWPTNPLGRSPVADQPTWAIALACFGTLSGPPPPSNHGPPPPSNHRLWRVTQMTPGGLVGGEGEVGAAGSGPFRVRWLLILREPEFLFVPCLGGA